jgi:hypothetical protein
VIVPGSAGVKRPHPGPLTELERAVLLGGQPPSALLPVAPPDASVISPDLPSQLVQELPLQEAAVPEPPVKEKEEQPKPGPPFLPSPPSDGTLPSPPRAESSPAVSPLPEEHANPLAEASPPLMPSLMMGPPQEPSSSAPTAPPQTAPPIAVPAREEVNPDGTLKRAPRSGPLERLRQRWNR